MNKISTKGLLDLAKDAIRQEAKTLSTLAENLDQRFVTAVRLLHQSSGRIVVTGVGKSALIAKKIAATFNSIGAPSIFMHAADAMHGDLGILQPNDKVIILSKSGETPEIKALTPAIRARGNQIISVVSNEDNHLALNSDIVILTPVAKEVDPNNLAPTASAMAQLAVGDAMAICLIHLFDFKSTDFAALHPAGMLGKRLNLRVSDLSAMNARPLVTPDAGIHQVIVEISSKRLGATAVVDNLDQLCGIITDGDLRRMLERNEDYRQKSAKDIMTSQPKTISDFAKAVDALQMMQKFNITQLLVTSEDSYVGVIHIHDLIREGFS